MSVDFDAKTYFPLIEKGVQFKRYGFKNEKDCNLLCKSTKELLVKYPKQSACEKSQTEKKEICIEANVEKSRYID